VDATRALSYLPLLPIVIPLVIAGLLVVFRRLFTPRQCALVVVLAAVASFLANCCWFKAPCEFSLVAIPFEDVASLFGSGLTFSLNQWGRLGGLLLNGMIALNNLATLKHPTSRGGAVLSLIMLAASQGFILSSNLFTLLLCWGLMDIALLGLAGASATDLEGTERATRGIALTQVAGLLVLIVALLTRREPSLALTSQVLLIIAAWIRMGAYPAQTRALRRESAPLSEMIAAHGLPLVAGLYMLIRVIEQGVPLAGTFTAISAVVCLLTGFMAFQARDLRLALSYIVLNQASAAMLLLFVMGPAGALAAWVTIANVLLGVSCIGQTDYVFPVSLGRWGRVPVLIAFLSLIGLPLTAGFASRWVSLQGIIEQGDIGLALILSLSGALLAAPLIKRAHVIRSRAAVEVADMGRAEWLSFGSTASMSVVILGLRVMPLLLRYVRGGNLGVPASAASSPFALVLLGFVVPIVGGLILERLDLHLFECARRGISMVTAIMDLDWVYALLQLFTRNIMLPLRYVMHIVEEQVYLGWILLWALVILLWLWG